MDPEIDMIEVLGRSRRDRQVKDQREKYEPLTQEQVHALADEAKARGANDDGDELK